MKVIYSILFALSISIFFSVEIEAQSFVSLSTGISMDLNNTNPSFYHIPVTLQWHPFSQKKSPFFLELNYDIPITSKSTGDAYTLNPGLPGEVTLNERIHALLFTASIGFRIHLYTNKKENSFYLNLMPVGICVQNFKVNYENFDKENYEVLNPDISLNKGGFAMGMAGAYNFHKGKQDMMIMLHLQTPPFQSRGDYPLSYNFIAPLQLTFGYNFYYNKSK
jgi:hypothetical protein